MLLTLAGCAKRIEQPPCRLSDDTTRVVAVAGSSVRAVRATGDLRVSVHADTEAVVRGRPTPTDTLILIPNAWQGSPEIRVALASCF